MLSKLSHYAKPRIGSCSRLRAEALSPIYAKTVGSDTSGTLTLALLKYGQSLQQEPFKEPGQMQIRPLRRPGRICTTCSSSLHAPLNKGRLMTTTSAPW